MNFKVVCQSTKEREQEIIDLFNKAKPHLDGGCSYRLSLQKVLGKKPTCSFSNRGWYKEFVEYADAHGYPKSEYRYKRSRSVTNGK